MVKNPPANAGDGRNQKDPLEEGMATPSSILAWRGPWTEEAGGGTGHGVTKSWLWLSMHGKHVYIDTYVYILFFIFFSIRLLQDIKSPVLYSRSSLFILKIFIGV